MNDFSPIEANIAQVHQAYAEQKLTAVELVTWYLGRIQTYDKAGPMLQAIVTVNHAALAEAATLDEHYRATGTFKGPLHGIPVLVKDQAETANIRTTFGTKAFEHYIPAKDATIIAKLKAAGAIILAKTSMCDFAAGWFSFSSMTDHTKNPYDPAREAGGSSAGTCAGLAANLGLVGIGEDTGGSIRLPASFNNLFGLRVTTGLISRTGLSPLVHFQDTPGPVARTVRDVAKLLDVMVGYDPADAYTTAALLTKDAGLYEHKLEAFAPDRIRIGVLSSGFGSAAECADVNAVVHTAIHKLKDIGLTVVDAVEIPDLAALLAETSLYTHQSKADLDRFLRNRNGEACDSFMDVYHQQLFHPMNDLFHDIANGPDVPESANDYFRRRVAQDTLRRTILHTMGQHDVQMLVFPDVQILPPLRSDLMAGKWGTLTFPTNTVIASQARLPAISVPAGFTEADIPVGMELLGMPYAELSLLQVAYQYEQSVRPRQAPALHMESV
ncbi:amidase [Alicyclobacillus fodiniaquatilis]|uniref:Amidase n=1 Tax=Alicyclobacillus fodiniaquatilis TaxID=1661150 RepID=A0ABW4JDD2_9BACL